MNNRLKGLRDISTFMNLRRSRGQAQYNEYEIFNELARLAREKVQLNKEKRNWQERIDWIDARLREIENLVDSLKGHTTEKEGIAPDIQHTRQAAGNDGRELIVKY